VLIWHHLHRGVDGIFMAVIFLTANHSVRQFRWSFIHPGRSILRQVST
jgi:hypothetical protein